MNLTDGILRCRYRDSFSTPEPMIAGHSYQVVVEAPDTANLFRAGHRLRLDVSSSNFPRFDVNSNTGETEVGDRRKVVATNRVYVGAGSRIVLPVLPVLPTGGRSTALSLEPISMMTRSSAAPSASLPKVGDGAG